MRSLGRSMRQTVRERVRGEGFGRVERQIERQREGVANGEEGFSRRVINGDGDSERERRGSETFKRGESVS
jgi:hypothetical protein